MHLFSPRVARFPPFPRALVFSPVFGSLGPVQSQSFSSLGTGLPSTTMTWVTHGSPPPSPCTSQMTGVVHHHQTDMTQHLTMLTCNNMGWGQDKDTPTIHNAVFLLLIDTSTVLQCRRTGLHCRSELVSTGLEEDWSKPVGKLQPNRSEPVVYGSVWLPKNWAVVAPDEGPKTGSNQTFKHYSQKNCKTRRISNSVCSIYILCALATK